MGLRAGELDRTIIVEKKTEVISTNGQRSLTWATFLTIRAGFLQKERDALGERQDNKNRTTGRMTQFKVRYEPTITTEMRIKFEDEWYKIEEIKEIKRRFGLLINTSLLAQT